MFGRRNGSRDTDGSVSDRGDLSLSMAGTKGPFAAYALRAIDIATGTFAAPVAMVGPRQQP